MSHFRCIFCLAIVPVCSILLVSSMTFAADDATASPPESAGVEVEFDDVVSASHIINAEVHDTDGEIIGSVADVVLDTEFGQLAFISIRNTKKVAKVDNVFFLPPSCLKNWSDDKGLKVNVSQQQIQDGRSKAKTLQPSLVFPSKLVALYERFGAKPYWPSERVQDMRLHLVSIDEMDGRVVRDVDRKKFARVDDVLLTPDKNWKVAYLSLRDLAAVSDGEQRLAIPLAAFVRDSHSAGLTLEIPAESELLKETFKTGNWPKEINRGWIEFVHVKYGKATLSGLQDVPDDQVHTDQKSDEK